MVQNLNLCHYYRFEVVEVNEQLNSVLKSSFTLIPIFWVFPICCNLHKDHERVLESLFKFLLLTYETRIFHVE